MICPICKSEKKSIRSLVAHMRIAHNLDQPEYKDIIFQYYPDLFIKCIECGTSIKKFKNAGGAETCSIECRNKAKHKINLGRKQSESQIKKRIESTDQKTKESTRKQTMFDKYGSLSYIPNPEDRSSKISSALSGKIRTKEHIQKIVDSKKFNKTDKHTDSTRTKIKNSLLKYYQEGDNQIITIPKNIIKCNGRGHKTGTFNKINYRSSYELLFLIFCEKNKIQIQSAESKQHRIRYVLDRKRWYYPDFYLPQYDIIVEIKPQKLVVNNEHKFKEAMKEYLFIVITEEYLLNQEILHNKIINVSLGCNFEN